MTSRTRAGAKTANPTAQQVSLAVLDGKSPQELVVIEQPRNNLTDIAEAFFNASNIQYVTDAIKLEEALTQGITAQQNFTDNLTATWGPVALASASVALIPYAHQAITHTAIAAGSLWLGYKLNEIRLSQTLHNQAFDIATGETVTPDLKETQKSDSAVERLSALFFRRAVKPGLPEDLLKRTLIKGIEAQQRVTDSLKLSVYAGIATTAFAAATTYGGVATLIGFGAMAIGAAVTATGIITNRSEAAKLELAAQTVTVPLPQPS